MSGKNFMSYGDADTILTEFSNDIKSRVSTKANQGLTAQQKANAKTNIGIDKVPNVATNDQTPTFLEESTRTNIASGDKLSLIFGKIKKFFSDLKTVAFSGSYNDLSDTPTLVECSTARNVAAKTVTLPGFKLKTGARISVRFTDTGSSNPASGHITLNVNGTGAKEIIDGHANMTKATYTYNWFYNNQTIEFIYDGTYWVNLNRDNNTTYSAMSTSELTTGTATTARSVRSDYLKAGINSLIDTKIGGLDVASVGGTGKYISAISETDGKISATASNMPTIPSQLSDLTDDSTHRTVTDTEKTTWNGKANKKTTIDSYYGTSSTAAATAAKVITVTDSDGNFSLRAGIAIMVKFSAQNTAQNPTFNVNNTGAKSVYYNNAVVTTGNLWAGGNTRPARYVYDGTYWVWMGHSMDNDTTYSAMSKAELTTGTATTSRTVRADYLKAGIEELIDGKIAGKADKTDIDDVYKVMGKNGAKNVIPFPYDGGGVGTHTVNGISFIVGPSGGITISGTATADADFAVAYWLEDILEDGKDYIVSAEGINGSLSTYYLSIENINRSMVVSSTVDVTHDEVQFTASAYRINCLLKVKSGQTISSVTIYPMIRLASDTDSTYQRYAKTNKQLTKEIGDISQTGLTGDSVAEQLADLKNMLEVEWFSINNTTPVPASSYNGFNIPFSKSGYMPLGVVGLTGSGTGNLSLVEFFINTDFVRVYYKNDTALDITPTVLRVSILFVKQ